VHRVTRWLFGDIASAFAPAPERGAGTKPTRRAARWLIGIGVFLTLFGVIGTVEEATVKLERQHATLVDRFTTRFDTRTTSAQLHKVRVRLEDGTERVITYAPLYDALGTRTELPVMVDVDPQIDHVHAVYVNGRRYYVGRHATALVVTSLFTALGVFLLLRGIGRRRRAHLMETGTE
jgi:hypothetical protein